MNKRRKQYLVKYRKDHKHEMKIYQHNYHRKWYKRNRRKHILSSKSRLKSWIGVIPQATRCQICGKNIYLVSDQRSKTIHFDHRHNGKEKIKCSPSIWLRTHQRNDKNEKIWNSCDFGMLCHRCNIFLPTMGRGRFLKNVMKYTVSNQ